MIWIFSSIIWNVRICPLSDKNFEQAKELERWFRSTFLLWKVPDLDPPPPPFFFLLLHQISKEQILFKMIVHRKIGNGFQTPQSCHVLWSPQNCPSFYMVEPMRCFFPLVYNEVLFLGGGWCITFWCYLFLLQMLKFSSLGMRTSQTKTKKRRSTLKRQWPRLLTLKKKNPCRKMPQVEELNYLPFIFFCPSKMNISINRKVLSSCLPPSSILFISEIEY